MDKIQIYAIILLFISFVTTGYDLVFFNEDDTAARLGKLLATLFGYAIGIPIYGRIFGWW